MGISKIRVLLFSPLPPPSGGIATWTMKYIDWCNKKNLDVDIINTAVTGKRAQQINSSRSIMDEIKRSMRLIREIKTKIKDNYPDVVHLNTPCGRFGIIRDYIFSIIVKKNNIPLVVHYRCNIEDQIKNNDIIQRYFLSKLINIADKNIVLNSTSKAFIKAITGRESELIANFIDEDFIIDEDKKINKDIKEIVFIGHVQISKGVREIIEVANKFRHINFTLAGPVANEISLLSIPNNVTLKGQVDAQEVRVLLSHADVFLFPTYTEGFSNALLEAMAMGLPIITTNVGANEDMIQSNGGILVRTKNCIDIVNAINQLEKQEYRQKISQWNLNRVRENYLIDRVMVKVFSIYKAIIKY